MIAAVIALLLPLSHFDSRLPAAMTYSGKESDEEAAKKSMFRWYFCLDQTVPALAKSSREPAETIVSASYGECARFEEVTKDFLRVAFPVLTETDLDQEMLKLRGKWRDHLTSKVLAARR